MHGSNLFVSSCRYSFEDGTKVSSVQNATNPSDFTLQLSDASAYQSNSSPELF